MAGTLILTHSSRFTDLNSCSVSHFTKRYSNPVRLKELPPFETLAPADKYSLYSGSVSFHRISESEDKLHYNFLGSIKTKKKIQHVIQVNSHEVIVGYENHIELWRSIKHINSRKKIHHRMFNILQRYDHPHFAGIHTIFPLNRDRLLVSCSAPESVFVLNLRRGIVEKSLRMPVSLYGQSYQLNDNMDLREHYISNDYQTSHLNCAYPSKDGKKIFVSTLIQGVIGYFDLESGNYKEITNGFIGCHGVRINDQNEIYFADSAKGCLVFLNIDGTIKNRFAIGSKWLHDVQQISGSIYAFSVADKNSIQLYNINTGKLLSKRRFLKSPLFNFNKLLKFYPFWFGNSTQFLSFYSKRN